MKKIIFFFLIVSMTVVKISSAQQMADYLSPAFPTDLVSNHKGDAIAWVFNDKGSRNIYYGQPATSNYKSLTSYKGDILKFTHPTLTGKLPRPFSLIFNLKPGDVIKVQLRELL